MIKQTINRSEDDLLGNAERITAFRSLENFVWEQKLTTFYSKRVVFPSLLSQSSSNWYELFRYFQKAVIPSINWNDHQTLPMNNSPAPSVLIDFIQDLLISVPKRDRCNKQNSLCTSLINHQREVIMMSTLKAVARLLSAKEMSSENLSCKGNENWVTHNRDHFHPLLHNLWSHSAVAKQKSMTTTKFHWISRFLHTHTQADKHARGDRLG